MVEWIQDVADRVRVVETICRGASVSVWGCRGEALDLVYGDAQRLAELVRRLWRGTLPALAEGRIVAREGLTLVPLRAGRRLTGLLVVAGPFRDDDLSRGYIDMLAERLGSQLGLPPEARLPLSLMAPAAARVRRGRVIRPGRSGLLELFERARGNLTLVADWLGVTRQTVYNYLDGYGIPVDERPRRGGRKQP
jgi:hypothetical protein